MRVRKTQHLNKFKTHRVPRDRVRELHLKLFDIKRNYDRTH